MATKICKIGLESAKKIVRFSWDGGSTGYGYRIQVQDTGTGYGYRIQVQDTGTGYVHRIWAQDMGTGNGIWNRAGRVMKKGDRQKGKMLRILLNEKRFFGFFLE